MASSLETKNRCVVLEDWKEVCVCGSTVDVCVRAEEGLVCVLEGSGWCCFDISLG